MQPVQQATGGTSLPTMARGMEYTDFANVDSIGVKAINPDKKMNLIVYVEKCEFPHYEES